MIASFRGEELFPEEKKNRKNEKFNKVEKNKFTPVPANDHLLYT